MTQEEKELLLKDLCARLPYNCRVFVEFTDDLSHETQGYSITLNTHYIYEFENDKVVIKPYLRPLSSMTEEEILELYKIAYDTWYNDSLYYKSEEWISFRDSIRNNTLCFKSSIWASDIFKVYDWLNAHHFDYRGLIEKGLALEAPKDMYNLKKINNMTQEEKAKRYDEALEELRGLLEGIREEKCKILEEDIISIFPELQENEDERIRKELIFYLGDMPEDTELRNGVTNCDVLAWLEKQGDKDELIKELGEYKAKYTQEVLEKHLRAMNKNDERLRKTTIAFLKDFADKGYENAIECIDWLEKQGEQKPQGKSALEAINEEKVDNQFCVKPVDKVEPKDYSSIDPHFGKPIDKVRPKFHEGDWVTDGYLHNKITDVLEDRYIVDTKYAKRSAILFDYENLYHLWTINDAKAGDILASKDGKSILIFRHFSLDDDTFASYYSITFSSYYYMQGYDEYNWLNTNFVPATKEQRDLLFQKMQEAGYEWDSEKKQLRKIESNFYLE